jgi:signal transduction histidine kinase
LAVPLHLGERVVGVLDIRSDRAEAFDAEDLRVVQTLANQIAIAINNARLYGKLSTLNETLEQRVQDRTAELNEAYRTLERLDQAKVDFISVTSHELRTPLTIISGYTQLLQSLNGSASPGDKEDLLKGIMSGTTRMQEIVNTMLDVSKIDSSVLRVHPETVVLGVVINLVAEKLSAAVAERNITLTIGSLSHLPTIQADPDLLHKLFHQLLINAIKYTPDGGQISIEAQHISYEQGHDVVEVMLADTGVGIDGQHLSLIFEKFYQTGEVALHSSGKTKYKGGGPGLGLAIAKGIVVAHQGRIWAESPGHDETACPGSQFYVQLPLRQEVRELEGVEG